MYSEDHCFTLIPGFLYDLNLSANHRELFGIVNGLSQREGYCYGSNEYLASRMKISERTVRRCLKELEAYGLVKIKKANIGSTTRVIIISDEWCSKAADNAIDEPAFCAPPVQPFGQIVQGTGQIVQSERTNCPNALYIDNERYNKEDIYTPTRTTDDSKPRKKTPPAKHQLGEYRHVHLTDDEVAKFSQQLGLETLTACINKLDAWIESDPTPKKVRNGRNAAACFRSWVIESVNKSKTTPMTQHERNMAILAGTPNSEGWQ